jgi:hypothetical protein
MKTCRFRLVFPALMLSAVLLVGIPSWALAQCGGGSGSMHDQHMGSSGHLGSGQIGMYGSQAPVQTDPNAVTPGYVAPAPPASGYADPQNTGGSGHSGHMGH